VDEPGQTSGEVVSLLDPVKRTETGKAAQREITGVAAPEPATPYEASWRDFLFAEVWTRPALDRRSRFLISIAGASVAETPSHILDGYVRGALTLKELTLAELREAALHIAVYCGWSRGGVVDAIRAEPWDPDVRFAEGEKNFADVMTFAGPKAPGPTAYLGNGILNFVFGEMWRRPGLDERSRRWLTLVGVSDSSSDIPIKTHIYAAMKSGNASYDEMNEFVLQYAVHAGWPKASVIQAVLFDQARRIKENLPPV
jgi:4-carboxymuconolactone decarboxylase